MHDPHVKDPKLIYYPKWCFAYQKTMVVQIRSEVVVPLNLMVSHLDRLHRQKAVGYRAYDVLTLQPCQFETAGH